MTSAAGCDVNCRPGENRQTVFHESNAEEELRKRVSGKESVLNVDYGWFDRRPSDLNTEIQRIASDGNTHGIWRHSFLSRLDFLSIKLQNLTNVSGTTLPE